VARPRLHGLLELRWERRLVTVVAGPGFGKTVALAQALAEGVERDHVSDVWLSAEPADESADHLRAGLVHALGLPGGSGVPEIVDAVWSRAPTAVCLVVDDVHEVPPDSGGARLLAEVLEELPGNGHLVLASRQAVPVPVARLAAGGQLVRVGERELLFEPDEQRALAHSHGVDPVLLDSTGGWPALAELTAVAGADLVLDYLWEEVLARVGADRARVLARFATVGGGDDAVASAVAGRETRVRDLVASVPLVHRSASAAVLHPLWGPVLRDLLSDAEASEARRQAADVHRRTGGYATAIALLAEAEAWDEVLEVLREAGTRWRAPAAPDELARWCRMLPAHLRAAPAALLAAGLERQARAPREAIPIFEAAVLGFRDQDDVEGEIAALFQQGVVCWWAQDLGTLLGLYERVGALAASGLPRAQILASLGAAGIASVTGDSEKVLESLREAGDDLPGDWPAIVRWLRSSAYFRLGDLPRARQEIDEADRLPNGLFATTVEVARLRLDWLAGEVEAVHARMLHVIASYAQTGSLLNLVSAQLSHALQAATLGDLDLARSRLAETEPLLEDVPGVRVQGLHLATLAAIAIGEGDEPSARELLRDNDVGAALMSGPDGSIWHEYVGYARVLVPEARQAFIDHPPGPGLRPGLELAEALDAARHGDLGPVRALRWPAVGVVRAHVPVRWVVELAVAGFASGNPPPDALTDALAPHLRPLLRAIIAAGPTREMLRAADGWLTQIPAVPAFRLRIAVLGPLEVQRDGQPAVDPELRRKRVRELLSYLVVHRRVRREAVAADLWPDLDDGGRNLRVTLSYLQHALQPDRENRDPPYFLRADGDWLTLTGRDHLDVDAWELQVRLDEAGEAERAGSPATALDAYRALLPLWRGEPYADVPYAPWADAERARLRTRFEAAAVRAGELLLAARELSEAQDAAMCAVTAEPGSESAYRVLIRARLADDDLTGARRALDECRAALAELGVEPEPRTTELIPPAG
jgi:DNA-binding SARP family transcriptional activator